MNKPVKSNSAARLRVRSLPQTTIFTVRARGFKDQKKKMTTINQTLHEMGWTEEQIDVLTKRLFDAAGQAAKECGHSDEMGRASLAAIINETREEQGGYFRNRGAATPVWCDDCNAKHSQSSSAARQNAAMEEWCDDPEAYQEDEAAGLEPGTLANDRRLAKRGLSVFRFSSGAVTTQNSRGRCEDAPCCGCCT